MLPLMKSRLLHFIISFFVLSSLTLLFLPTPASAEACTFKVVAKDPAGNEIPPHQSADSLFFSITSSQIPKGQYQFNIEWPEKVEFRNFYNLPIDGGVTTSIIEWKVNRSTYYWRAGVYKIHVLPNNSSPNSTQSVCDPGSNNTFYIPETPAHPNCKVVVKPGPIDPSTTIEYEIQGNGLPTGKSYDVFLNTTKSKDNSVEFKTDPQPGNLITPKALGFYTITLRNQCGWFTNFCGNMGSRMQCQPAAFRVAPHGSGAGGPVVITSPTPIPRGTPVSAVVATCEYEYSLGTFSTPKTEGLQTGLGCIPKRLDHLMVGVVIFIVLGVGGTVTFLLMIAGAFEMITSSGNPDALKKGQDRLFSALQGFLFIILSLLLLQIIGAGILNIPGFT